MVWFSSHWLRESCKLNQPITDELQQNCFSWRAQQRTRVRKPTNQPAVIEWVSERYTFFFQQDVDETYYVGGGLFLLVFIAIGAFVFANLVVAVVVTNLVSKQVFKCAGNREKTALVCDMLTIRIQAWYMGLIQILRLLKIPNSVSGTRFVTKRSSHFQVVPIHLCKLEVFEKRTSTCES